MVKLEKTEKLSLINATVLGNKYRGSANFEIIAVETGDYFNEGKDRVKLTILNANDKYQLVLNKTNSTIIADFLENLGKDSDTDNIEIGTRITLESYDTGSSGTYKYGVRITDMVLPSVQEKLTETKKPKKAKAE